MRRREFIGVVGAIVGWPGLAVGQNIPRVSVLLGTGNDAQGQTWLDAFQQHMKRLGWIDGHNVSTEVVWGDADIDHIRTSAAKMVASKPDVIFVYTVRVLNAVRQATRDIPIVFVATNDPVGLGIVSSLSRPGGNLTGFMLYEVSVAGKLVELLKELVPGLRRVALLYNPTNDSAGPYWRLIQSIARTNGISAVSYTVHDASSIEQALTEFAREPNGGVVLPADATTTTYWKPIVDIAQRHRLPVVYSFSAVTRSGGLISYGPDTADLFVRGATYVDRILKGERPSGLPVQAPTKFTLAINLKTAKSMGLQVPTSVLLRADEVIE